MSKNNNMDLFDRITSEENIYKAYKKAMKGKGKYKQEAMVFARDETYNLKKLRESLIDGTYKFSGYITFTVKEPKERVIDAPHFVDKIVQLAINQVLKEIYNKSFIHDSYACIDDKGTHKCVDRIQYFIRKAKWEYGEDAYIIKFDIKKFFYTINRDILKKILSKKIKCKRTLDLLFKIIDSADILDLLGLPLGNTLSQLGANIYMNEIDQYIKRGLSIKFYARYADDGIIIVENKEKAIEVLNKLEQKIREVLELEFNLDKTQKFPINRGVNTVGYKIYATHRLLRNESKKKIKRKVKKFRPMLIDGRITIEKVEEILASWMGHASHGSSRNFILSLIERNDYIYIEEKIVTEIDKYTGKESTYTKKLLKVDRELIEKEREELDRKKWSEMGTISV